MAYTFWYSGILIGESDFEDALDNPRRLSGAFRPTAFGEGIFPRLTGVLTAGHALKNYLDSKGLDPETMDADQVEELFETNEAAQKILDIGRSISEVETRAPDGKRLEFKSIAFIDMLEHPRVLRELNGETAPAAEDRIDGPRYVVAGTLLDEIPAAIRTRMAGPTSRRHSPSDN